MLMRLKSPSFLFIFFTIFIIFLPNANNSTKSPFYRPGPVVREIAIDTCKKFVELKEKYETHENAHVSENESEFLKELVEIFYVSTGQTANPSFKLLAMTKLFEAAKDWIRHFIHAKKKDYNYKGNKKKDDAETKLMLAQRDKMEAMAKWLNTCANKFWHKRVELGDSLMKMVEREWEKYLAKMMNEIQRKHEQQFGKKMREKIDEIIDLDKAGDGNILRGKMLEMFANYGTEGGKVKIKKEKRPIMMGKIIETDIETQKMLNFLINYGRNLELKTNIQKETETLIGEYDKENMQIWKQILDEMLTNESLFTQINIADENVGIEGGNLNENEATSSLSNSS